jgi:hypothetical protein
LEGAKEEIKKALANREERFIHLARTQIYEHPSSPYLKLIKIAGCVFADLQTQVRRYGLEATLQRLAREGVYLTAEKFKGKKAVVRGQESFRVAPSCFESSNVGAGYQTQSSGTTNDPIRSFASLDLLAIRTPVTYFAFLAHDLFSHAHAMYEATLPGSAGVNNLMIYARMGVVAERWFARKIPIRSKIESMYHYLATQLLVHAAMRFGPGFPKPEFIETNEINRIVHWAAEKQRQKTQCCIATAASNATRIARVASRSGTSLAGTKFIVSGEPFTKAKQEVIEKAGARATPRYAYGGSVNIGYGCAKPVYTDEIHVNKHLVALFPHPCPRENAGLTLHPLLCTTLHPPVPRLLFNVENGDYGCLTRRNCGCALEEVGLSLHLHHIRSFEKFTSEGMNYYYGDLFDLIEEILPAEFGGGPGDYQLVEEEDSDSQTRLTLLVHPEVGELNKSRILSRLKEGLAQGSRSNRFMSSLWQDVGTFRVKRDIPHCSGRGKLLPLHIATRPHA